MARIRPEDVDKYQNTGGEFFVLKDDKDTAVVHVMAETMEDIEVYVIHKVQEGDKTRNVNCLRLAGEPIDTCPLCAAGIKPEVRVFVQLYDVNEEKVKVWDRGKTFLQMIDPIARRNPKLYERPIEIERNGAKGDTKTRYSLFPLEFSDDYPKMKPEDFPELIEISGREKTIILDRTYEELEAYLNGASLVESDPQETPQKSLRQPASNQRTVRPTGRRSY